MKVDDQYKIKIDERITFNYSKISKAGSNLLTIYNGFIILLAISFIVFIVLFILEDNRRSYDIISIYYFLGACQLIFLIILLSNLKSAAKNLKNSVLFHGRDNVITPISDKLDLDYYAKQIAKDREQSTIIPVEKVCPACAAEIKNMYVEECPKCGLKFN